MLSKYGGYTGIEEDGGSMPPLLKDLGPTGAEGRRRQQQQQRGEDGGKNGGVRSGTVTPGGGSSVGGGTSAAPRELRTACSKAFISNSKGVAPEIPKEDVKTLLQYQLEAARDGEVVRAPW
jgi:hypothetical protein